MSHDRRIPSRRIAGRRIPAAFAVASGILLSSPGCSTTPRGASSFTLTREESRRADADAARVAREMLEEKGLAATEGSSRFDSSSHIDAEVFPAHDDRVYGPIEVEWVPSPGDLDCPCGAAMICTGAVRVVKRLDGRVEVEPVGLNLTGEEISSVLMEEEYRIVCPGAREPPIRRKSVHQPFVLMARATAYDTRPIILQQLLGPRESRMEKPLEVAWLIGEGDCP